MTVESSTDLRLSSPWPTRVQPAGKPTPGAFGGREACMVASRPGVPARRRGTRATSAWREDALWTGRANPYRETGEDGKPVARDVSSIVAGEHLVRRVVAEDLTIRQAARMARQDQHAAAADAMPDVLARRAARRAERGGFYAPPGAGK